MGEEAWFVVEQNGPRKGDGQQGQKRQHAIEGEHGDRGCWETREAGVPVQGGVA